MSFSALLGKITKDKKLEEKAKVLDSKSNQSQILKQSQSNIIKRTPSLSALSALSSISYPQEEDPAVTRLKEARRLEKEKQLAIKNAKYGTKLTSSRKQSTLNSTSKITSKQKQQKSLQQQQQQRQKSPPLPPPPPKSRFKFKPLKHNLKISANDVQRKPSSHVSFSQLMEQASKIENPLTATSFHFIKKPQLNQPSKAYQSLQKSRSRQTESAPPSTSSASPASSSSQKSIQRSGPTFAKPNPELLKRLQKKQKLPLEKQRINRQIQSKTNQFRSKSDNYNIDAQDDDDEFDNYDYNDYDEYEDDGFIVDDNEHDEFNDSRQREYQSMRSKGYSKDEIWSIFNRNGRKRDYDDYDDYSDMEATGTEILEEEDRTLKAAKLDDLREQKLLQEKAREKKKRLKRL